MKLAQLNIERAKHLDRFLPVLLREMPDIVCLEEVMERSLPRISETLGMQASYVPMCILSGYEPECEGDRFGIALLSRAPHTLVGEHYYVGSRDTLRLYSARDTLESRETNIYKALLLADVQVGGFGYRVGCTHFTWSADGAVSERQRTDLKALGTYLDLYPELILCGDFNIPRGNELYQQLVGRFKDHAPPEATTTLDAQLHYAGALEYVVDYVFSTPGYRASNVRLISGVSDHLMIVADVA